MKQPGKMDYKADWSFRSLCGNRIKALSACPPYSEIIRRIEERIKPEGIKFMIDEGWSHPATGALRPLFYTKVGAELADLFFNGVCGYRAQYYLSAANGVDANRYAIQQIETKLLEAARIAGWCTPDPNCPDTALRMEEPQIRASLCFTSAKIWGDETEDEVSCVTKSADRTAQIIATRWVKAAKIEDKAARGVKAPRLSTLKFHGGFIKNGKEKIACGKENRSDDIHRYGWS